MLQSAGCIPATTTFLQMLSAEATATGALLIFDEVVTSRLHPGGMHGALGLKPDLVTLGKYLGGGLSFGAFGGARRVMERFDPRTPGFAPHAGTFNNDTLTMAVAYAGLSQIYTPETAVALNARGEALRASLNTMARAHQAQMQFTGIGSIMNAHMTSKDVFSPNDAALGNVELRELLYFHLLDRGIHIAKRGMISLSVVTSQEQIAHLEEAVLSFLDTYRALVS
jgi:glutamate-1-semialdehyde 2,1-aminomutase